MPLSLNAYCFEVCWLISLWWLKTWDKPLGFRYAPLQNNYCIFFSPDRPQNSLGASKLEWETFFVGFYSSGEVLGVTGAREMDYKAWGIEEWYCLLLFTKNQCPLSKLTNQMDVSTCPESRYNSWSVSRFNHLHREQWCQSENCMAKMMPQRWYMSKQKKFTIYVFNIKVEPVCSLIVAFFAWQILEKCYWGFRGKNSYCNPLCSA